jgi:hypothetical protein
MRPAGRISHVKALYPPARLIHRPAPQTRHTASLAQPGARFCSASLEMPAAADRTGDRIEDRPVVTAEHAVDASAVHRGNAVVHMDGVA